MRKHFVIFFRNDVIVVELGDRVHCSSTVSLSPHFLYMRTHDGRWFRIMQGIPLTEELTDPSYRYVLNKIVDERIVENSHINE